MQAVILSFDSLAANVLGCYGNDWIETPNCDRLAAAGVVFEQHFAVTLGPDSGMAWAIGANADSSARPATSVSIGRELMASGVTSKFIIANGKQPWQQCAEIEDIQFVEGRDGPGVKPDEVPIAHLIKSGLSAWNDSSFQARPRLLWLHSPAPGPPPHGFDSLYFEDFEDRGQQISELSDQQRTEHPAAYAGAVSLVDHWIGELLAGIEEHSQSEPTLLIVTAAKGYLWQRIATANSIEQLKGQRSVCDQTILAPLLLRVTGDDRFEDYRCSRSRRLVQTCDLLLTLCDWFQVAPRADESPPLGQSWLKELSEEAPSRQSLRIAGDNRFDAVRTSDWLCVRNWSTTPVQEGTISDQIPRASLYVKPDDIWDINDIASQQPEVVSDLWSLFPIE